MRLLLLCVAAATAFTSPKRCTSAPRLAPLAASDPKLGVGTPLFDKKVSKSNFVPPGSEPDDIPEECTFAVDADGNIDEAMLEACREKAADGFVQKSHGVLDENSY
tara:strand:- start:16 stop:333 length:318 start_codon:yes stop_codon:yes gene_type:complete